MNDAAVLRMLEKHRNEFHPIIKSKQPFHPVDLSKNNVAFTADIYKDLNLFSAFINEQRKKQNGALLIGGYREVRSMYEASELFDTKEQSRDLHLGIDIWGEAGTPVCAPLGGMVHSFANNDAKGDYGATIILQHQIETLNFYTLYGHLSLADIQYLRKGQFISRGEMFAHFGEPHENGNWPPHLHLQIILDLSVYEGDYPGVCKMSEADAYLSNSPDPFYLFNT